MSTQDVPGANPCHQDELAAGCWAEHDDGSLLFVKGTENDQVVYELYDVVQDPPVYYQDAMRLSEFEKSFSHPPTGVSDVDWTWHDKTPFPWSRVMKSFDKPVPLAADVHDTLSAAQRVAESLRLRGQKLRRDAVGDKADQIERKGRGVIDRLERAFAAFME